MSSSSAGLRQLLQILPEISDGSEHDLSQVAERANMSVNELTKKLHTLVDRLDVPGGFVEGVQVYLEPTRVSVVTQHFRRPMRLTRAELGALELGLAMLRAAGTPEDRSSADAALSRLRSLITQLPENDRQDGIRHAELSSGGNVAHLATLRDALRARKVVKLTYRSAGATEAEERRVRPYGLVYSSGQWYLAAYCESRNAVRHFRLDRVEGAESTEDGYSVPASFSIEESMSEHGVFSAGGAASMKVRYSSRIARWIAEREKCEPEADGTLTLEHPMADQEWAVRHVLQYGPEAEVLEPASLRKIVAERARLLAGLAVGSEAATLQAE